VGCGQCIVIAISISDLPVYTDRYLSLAMQLAECKAYGRGSKPTPATQRRVKLFEEETNTTPIPRPRDVQQPEAHKDAAVPIPASISFSANPSSSSSSLVSVNKIPVQITSRLKSQDTHLNNMFDDPTVSTKRSLSNGFGHDADTRHRHKRLTDQHNSVAQEQPESILPLSTMEPVDDDCVEALTSLRRLNVAQQESLPFATGFMGYHTNPVIVEPCASSEANTPYRFQVPHQCTHQMDKWTALRLQHEDIPKEQRGVSNYYTLWWNSCNEFIFREILFTCYARCHCESIQKMLSGWLEQSVNKCMEAMLVDDTGEYLCDLDDHMREIGVATLRLFEQRDSIICLPEFSRVDAGWQEFSHWLWSILQLKSGSSQDVIEKTIVESDAVDGDAIIESNAHIVSTSGYDKLHAIFRAAVAVILFIRNEPSVRDCMVYQDVYSFQRVVTTPAFEDQYRIGTDFPGFNMCSQPEIEVLYHKYQFMRILSKFVREHTPDLFIEISSRLVEAQHCQSNAREEIRKEVLFSLATGKESRSRSLASSAGASYISMLLASDVTSASDTSFWKNSMAFTWSNRYSEVDPQKLLREADLGSVGTMSVEPSLELGDGGTDLGVRTEELGQPHVETAELNGWVMVGSVEDLV
jgi:hypothetical protein